MAELNSNSPPIPRWPWIVAVVLGLGLIFYFLQPILLPFVLGSVFAYLGDPLVDTLERHRLGRTQAVVLVFLIFTTALIIAGLLAVPMLLQQLDALIRQIPDAYDWLTRTLVPWLQTRLSIPEAVLPEIDWSGQLANNWQSWGAASAKMLKQVTGSGANLLLGLFNLALVPVVAFYLMRDWDLLMARLLRLLPRVWQDKVGTMVGEADEVLGSFIRGQMLVMTALGLIYTAGLWLIGVQLALVLGLIAGLASIVPYLGFLVGILASCIAAYAQFQELGVLLWVALVFGVGQVLESMVLTPILVGDRIGLHPVAVIFALMAGGQLAGFVGVLLALPFSAVVMVFLRHAVAYYRASELYSGD